MTSKLVPTTGKRLPPAAGKGRPKGSRNKITMNMKQALEQAFWDVGGVQWLVTLAKTEPRTFAMLLAKLIPQEQADGEGERTITIIGGFTSEDFRSDPDADIDA